jgi:hypothetical protein
MVLLRKVVSRLPSMLLAGILAAAPLKIGLLDFSIDIAPSSAHAQGNSGGQGGGSGSGGGGNSGNGGSGNSGKGIGHSDSGASGPAGRNAHGGPAQRGRVDGRGRSAGVGVRHRDGISERVVYGRYEMRDAQGRLIVNRPAKLSDYTRLRALNN